MIERTDAQPGHRARLYASYRAFDPEAAAAGSGRGQAAYFRKHILPHLPKDRRARIVDIACGDGALVAWLATQGYARAEGVDASEEQVRAARGHGRTSVALGDAAEYLRGRVGVCDAVIACDFLEHLTKDEVLETLSVVRAALVPGGRFIAQTCNAGSPLFGRIRYGDLTHETAFTPRSLRQAFRAAGLTPLAVRGIDPAVHGAKSAGRAIAWTAIKAAMAAYLLVESGTARDAVVSQDLIAVAQRPLVRAVA